MGGEMRQKPRPTIHDKPLFINILRNENRPWAFPDTLGLLERISDDPPSPEGE
jgi:hypothetical protein